LREGRKEAKYAVCIIRPHLSSLDIILLSQTITPRIGLHADRDPGFAVNEKPDPGFFMTKNLGKFWTKKKNLFILFRNWDFFHIFKQERQI